MKPPRATQQALIRLDQIANQFTGIGVVSHRPDRHDHDQIGAASPWAQLAPPAVLAALGAKPPGKTVIGQKFQFGVDPQVDATAIAINRRRRDRQRMYFSRRKLTQPSPPSPASTRMMTSSTNFIGLQNRGQNKKPGRGSYTLGEAWRHIAPAGCSRTCWIVGTRTVNTTWPSALANKYDPFN